jgi:single stranded DNA-binding protein
MNGIEAALTGRLGTEPELKISQAGKPWAAFNVGVGDGDNVQWVRIAVFGERARELSAVLHKGDRVYVEGAIRLNEWTGKDGEKRAGLSVAAWKCEKLGQIGRNKPPKAKPSNARESAAAAHQQPTTSAARDWRQAGDATNSF